MTRYVLDEADTILMRTWSTGRGEWAAPVCPLPAGVEVERLQVLAAELTGLSTELWRCYTRPPSPDADDEVNSEDWRRQQIRDTFSTDVAALMNPNVADENGNLDIEYDPVGESAHRVGRALLEIGDDTLHGAVRSDVEAELQAVRDAERGNLAGRAGQAAVLSRADAHAGQIAAADAALRQDPLDAWTRLRELEPTAAAIAAAQWLKAAVLAVARFARMAPRRVLPTADEEAGIRHRAAAKILAMLDHVSAYGIVTYEVGRALNIAEGYTFHLDDKGDDDEIVELTLLNPQRPAPDLLEELLDAIRSCGELYARYVEVKSAAAADSLDDDAVAALFCDAVRARADLDRITLS